MKTSLKDLTRKRRTGEKSSSKGYKVEDGTKINYFSTFLSSNRTKDNLTLYLAYVAVKKGPIVAVTRASVLTNLPIQIITY